MKKEEKHYWHVEVMQSPDKNLWKKTIEEEKKSLEKNNTWEAAKPEEIRRKEVNGFWR